MTSSELDQTMLLRLTVEQKEAIAALAAVEQMRPATWLRREISRKILAQSRKRLRSNAKVSKAA